MKSSLCFRVSAKHCWKGQIWQNNIYIYINIYVNIWYGQPCWHLCFKDTWAQQECLSTNAFRGTERESSKEGHDNLDLWLHTFCAKEVQFVSIEYCRIWFYDLPQAWNRSRRVFSGPYGFACISAHDLTIHLGMCTYKWLWTVLKLGYDMNTRCQINSWTLRVGSQANAPSNSAASCFSQQTQALPKYMTYTVYIYMQTHVHTRIHRYRINTNNDIYLFTNTYTYSIHINIVPIEWISYYAESYVILSRILHNIALYII